MYKIRKPIVRVGMNAVVDICVKISANHIIKEEKNLIVTNVNCYDVFTGIIISGTTKDGKPASYNQSHITKIHYFGDTPFRKINIYRENDLHNKNKGLTSYNKNYRCVFDIRILISEALASIDAEILTPLRNDVIALYKKDKTPGLSSKRINKNNLCIVKWAPFKKWVIANHTRLVMTIKSAYHMEEMLNDDAEYMLLEDEVQF